MRTAPRTPPPQPGDPSPLKDSLLSGRGPVNVLHYYHAFGGPTGRPTDPGLLLAEPMSLLTTLEGPGPIELESAGNLHESFSLTLAGHVLVHRLHGRRAHTDVAVPGHVTLNPSGEPFRYVLWPPPGLLTVHVTFPPEWLAEVRRRELPGRGGAAAGLPSFLAAWHEPLRRASLQIADALRSPVRPSRLRMDQLHLGLAVALLRLTDGPRSPAEPVPGRLPVHLLRRAIDYVDAHLGEDVSLATLAAQVDLSPYHFARSFRVTVGVPPHRYLAERRIERARALLAATPEPLTTIALNLGFASPSHFSSAFRRHVGLTPSAFRGALAAV